MFRRIADPVSAAMFARLAPFLTPDAVMALGASPGDAALSTIKFDQGILTAGSERTLDAFASVLIKDPTAGFVVRQAKATNDSADPSVQISEASTVVDHLIRKGVEPRQLTMFTTEGGDPATAGVKAGGEWEAWVVSRPKSGGGAATTPAGAKPVRK